MLQRVCAPSPRGFHKCHLKLLVISRVMLILSRLVGIDSGRLLFYPQRIA